MTTDINGPQPGAKEAKVPWESSSSISFTLPEEE